MRRNMNNNNMNRMWSDRRKIRKIRDKRRRERVVEEIIE